METPKQHRATAKQAERAASHYIVHKLGDSLWAGEPIFDESSQEWKVPIRSRSLPEDISLGEIVLDRQGAVVSSPTRSTLQRVIAKYRLSETHR